MNTAFTAWIIADSIDYLSTISTSCMFTNNFEFEVLINKMTAGLNTPHSIRIDNIVNPSIAAGTASFKLETRIGTANVFDYNHVFDQIGLIAAPIALSSVSVTISTSSIINQLGTYSIVFTNTKQIPIAGAITITLPGILLIQSGFSCTNNVNPGATCTMIDINNIRIAVI